MKNHVLHPNTHGGFCKPPPQCC